MHGFRALKSEVIMSNMTNAAPHTPIQEADYSAIHPPFPTETPRTHQSSILVEW